MQECSKINYELTLDCRLFYMPCGVKISIRVSLQISVDRLLTAFSIRR